VAWVNEKEISRDAKCFFLKKGKAYVLQEFFGRSRSNLGGIYMIALALALAEQQR